MKLLHLRIACYLYNQFSNYDENYLKLSKKYPNLKLNETEHVKALVTWLRSWGCRQFKIENEKISINSIKDWYKSNKSKISRLGDYLLELDLNTRKNKIIEIFNDLSMRSASKRSDKIVCIGPVGTAKTLFALRPNLFSPWDTRIYQKFSFEGNGSGYVAYLSKIQTEMKEIKVALKGTKIKWDKLFDYLKQSQGQVLPGCCPNKVFYI